MDGGGENATKYPVKNEPERCPHSERFFYEPVLLFQVNGIKGSLEDVSRTWA
jgi:hypothetical protein